MGEKLAYFIGGKSYDVGNVTRVTLVNKIGNFWYYHIILICLVAHLGCHCICFGKKNSIFLLW